MSDHRAQIERRIFQVLLDARVEYHTAERLAVEHATRVIERRAQGPRQERAA